MSFNLDFLKNVQLEAVEKAAPKAKSSTPKLPEEADIRLFKNGSVFPSKAFAEKHSLEYGVRNAIPVEGKEDKLVASGNGIDIFSSKDWGMLAELPQEVIFCAVVPKADAKVDMWGSTKYEDDGQPKASVFTQGSNTFAKTRLVFMIAAAYGVDWSTTEYVDLSVVADQPMVSPNGRYIVPKIISTGEKKGQPTYIIRENLTVCPLVVSNVHALEPKAEVAADVIGNKTPEAPVNESPAETTEDQGEDWAAKLGQPTETQAAE